MKMNLQISFTLVLHVIGLIEFISAFTLDHATGHKLSSNHVSDETLRELLRSMDEPETPQKYEHKTRGAEEIPMPQKHEQKERASLKRGNSAEGVQSSRFYLHDGTSYEKSVQEVCMHAHNTLRQRHVDTPDLIWDATLAAESEVFAKELVEQETIYHSKGPYGENLFFSTNTYGAVSSAAHAALSWYSESFDPNPEDGNIVDYNFLFNPSTPSAFYSSGVGHFSQVVWAQTVRVGCGVATMQSEKNGYTWTNTVVVARYTPGGNLLNNFADNVNALKSGKKPSEDRPSISEVIPGAAPCKNVLDTNNCIAYEGYGYCFLVEKDCNCECTLYGNRK